MDSVTPAPRRDVLRKKVEAARGLLGRSASVAFVQGDPLAEQMNAISVSLGAMLDIAEVIDDMQIGLTNKLEGQPGAIAKEMTENVRVSSMAIAKELGPQLIRLAEGTMWRALRALQFRTFFGTAAALVVLVLLVGAYTYAAGLNNGRTQGEDAAHTIQAAMTYSPDTAITWGHLMAVNDPSPEMALCKKNITTGADGRRSCDMPVWLDPPISKAPQP